MVEPAASVRRIRADEWQAFKELRLRALLDAPTAFGSTYDEQRALADDHWQRRAREGAESDDSVLFVAERDGALRGMAWAVADAERRDLAHLYGMFVDPALRGRDVGRALVEAVCGWARSRGLRAVLLDVTDVNAPAIALYERCGFARTGRTQPLPHTPSITEIEMERVVG
ncbi:MAG: GNAT family N-acetyltransferase [Chloroflexota bacterium]|nr:GNAT family N-acetyltransferase [Chloroflexota bacterium]